MTEAVAREPARWRRRSHLAPPCALVLALVALATSAVATADAAQLVDVRVGRHPEFVRVVFETDAPAAFAIAPGGTPGETLVRLEAELAPFVAARAATGESGADVQLESLPGGGTLARIRASVPVRVESQVLDEPPRVVLDLREASETAEAPPEEEAPPREEATPLENGEPSTTGADPARREAEPDVARVETEDAGEDPVAALLADLPETPPPSEPAPPSPPSEPPARPEPPAPPAPVESPLPPVSGAPPAAIAARFDGRSLVIGGVAGLVLGVALSLSSRSRGPGERRGAELLDGGKSREEEIGLDALRDEESAAALVPIPGDRRPDTEPDAASPEATEAPAGPPFAGSRPAGDSLAADLLQMIQRLDDRAARGDELLNGLHERVEWLDRRTNAQAEELASQRLAIARLQRGLGHPPVRLATNPGRGTRTPASRPRES